MFRYSLRNSMRFHLDVLEEKEGKSAEYGHKFLCKHRYKWQHCNWSILAETVQRSAHIVVKMMERWTFIGGMEENVVDCSFQLLSCPFRSMLIRLRWPESFSIEINWIAELFDYFVSTQLRTGCRTQSLHEVEVKSSIASSAVETEQ